MGMSPPAPELTDGAVALRMGGAALFFRDPSNGVADLGEPIMQFESGG